MSEFPESLVGGYRSFKDGRFVRERATYRALYEQGQAPEIMVIACSDSRSAPETIFNAATGEIFVVRNVANLVPPYGPDSGYHGTSAAIEFAVQSLKVKHIVVLGHRRCGGIQAALQPTSESLSPGDFTRKWLKLVDPVVSATTACSELADGERQTALERASICASLANLRTFPFVSIQEKRNRLGLHGAWFDISEGDLWTMDPSTGDFLKRE